MFQENKRGKNTFFKSERMQKIGRKIYKNGRRVVALALAFVMMLQLEHAENLKYVFAAGSSFENGEIYLVDNGLAPSEFTAKLATAQVITGAPVIPYGDVFSVKVGGYQDSDVNIMAIASTEHSDAGWSNWGDPEIVLEPGNSFYLGYTVNNSSTQEDNRAYGFTVGKANLDVPTDIACTDTTYVASWSENRHTATNSVGTIKGDTTVEYQVLLKDWEDATVVDQRISETTLSLDSYIKAHGYGKYKLYVKEIPTNNTTYYLESAFSDGLEVEWEDIVNPIVSDISAAAPVDGAVVKLQATAKDEGRGLQGYAFSTSSSADGLVFTDVETVGTKEEQTVTFTLPTDADGTGTYYFYAKDTVGNISVSNPVSVTQVEYHKFSQDNSASKISYLVGVLDAAGKTPMTPETVDGYVNEGWYENSDFSGDKVVELAHRAQKIDLYPKKLLGINLKADNITITYGETPDYTYTVNDGAYSALDYPATITGPATVGGYVPAGTYTDGIAVKDCTVPDRYYGYVNGTLTVKPKNATAGGSGVTVTIPGTSFVYDGTEKKFAKEDIVIEDSKALLTADDYTITYDNNINAGTASVIVTFKNNYTGTIRRNFSIDRQNLGSVVLMSIPSSSDWSYGDAAKAAILTDGSGNNVSDSYDGEKYYYYLKGADASSATTTQPTDAGIYYAYAIIPATKNQAEYRTTAIEFTIKKKQITITSETEEFTFNGNTFHATKEPTYTGLVGADAFSMINLSKSIKNVGEVENTIVWEASDRFKANYEVKTSPGKLIVKAAVLPNIDAKDFGFSDDISGLAEWVPVTRDGVECAYEITLYYKNGGDYTKVGETITTEKKASEYDISAKIKDDFQARKKADGELVVGAYCFTIRAIPAAGENQKNYLPYAGALTKSAEIYATEVTLQQKAGEKHFKVLGFEDGSVSKKIMLSGESVPVHIENETGYSFNRWEYEEEAKGIFTYNYSLLTFEKEKVPAKLAVLQGTSHDSSPIVYTTKVRAAEDGSKIVFRVDAYDGIGIRKYMVTTQAHPGKDDPNWITLEKATQYLEKDVEITIGDFPGGSTAERYYVWVQDTIGQMDWGYSFNVDTLSNGFYGGTLLEADEEKGSIPIYKISFKKAATVEEAAEVTGSMDGALKLYNVDMNLPALKYAKEHFSFRNWKSTKGTLYADGGAYSQNEATVMTASWSDVNYDYTVKYYYMNPDGTYPKEPAAEDIAIFSGAAGSTINYNDAKIQKLFMGYELDSTNDGKAKSVFLNAENKVIEIYYSRVLREITYTYTFPGDADPTVHTYRFRYGAVPNEDDINDQLAAELAARPDIKTGYTMPGWDYGKAGKLPETMPNSNIQATGIFLQNDASYQVHYFVETIDSAWNVAAGKTFVYEKLVKEEETVNAPHAAVISFDTSDPTKVKELEGFTLQGVTVTTKTADATSKKAGDLNTSVDGTVSKVEANALHVNYYYTRNTYKISAQVRIPKSGAGEDAYETIYNQVVKSGIPYGYELNKSNENDYGTFLYYEKNYENSANYTTDKAKYPTYRLSEAFSWSTGWDTTSADASYTMPAGDVVVSKNYVDRGQSSYNVEVYLEKVTEGDYPSTRDYLLVYPVAAGIDITVSAGASDSDDTTLKYGDMQKILTVLQYYELDETKMDLSETHHVSDVGNGEAPMTIKVYAKRKSYPIKVSFKYKKSGSSTATEFATDTISGRWGTTDYYDILMHYTDTVSGGTETYLTGKYAVSYDHYYRLQADGGHWSNNQIRYSGNVTGENIPGDQLTYKGVKENGGVEVHFGTNDTASYINVYYSEVKTDQKYYVDLKYDNTYLSGIKSSTNIPAGEKTGFITVQAEDGNTYQVRIANRNYVMTTTPDSIGEDPEYPVAKLLYEMYNRELIYTGPNTSNGFSNEHVATVGGLNFFWKEEDGIKYIYLMDYYNTLFDGNRGSVSISGNSYGFVIEAGSYVFKNVGSTAACKNAIYKILDDTLSDYKAKQQAEDFSKYIRDDAYLAARRDDDGYYASAMSGNGTYTLRYEYDNLYVHYVFEGSGEQKTSPAYGKGTVLTYEKHKANASIADKTGYVIKWYLDSAYTKPVAEEYTMVTSVYMYGHYEKELFHNVEYAHYQIPDPYSFDDGEHSLDIPKYVTKDDILKLQDYGEYDREGSGWKTVSTSDGYNYFYKDVLVLKEIRVNSEAFTELSMNYSTHNMEGFHYDAANPDNLLSAYCQYKAVALDAYFERDTFTISWDPDYAKRNNIDTIVYATGQNVTYPDPEKRGYDFVRWDFTDEEGNSVTPATTHDAAGTHLKMEKQNLNAKAVYSYASYTEYIWHYFQGVDQVYDVDTVKAIMKDSVVRETGKDVSVNGADAVKGTWYKQDDTVIGVSVEVDGAALLFKNPELSGSIMNVKSANMICARVEYHITTGDAVELASHKFTLSDANKSLIEMFEYYYATYELESKIDEIKTATFEANPEATVRYFYKRKADTVIEVTKAASDLGAKTGLTIQGAGNHYYGQIVTMKADLDPGYEFVGWFIKSDYDAAIEAKKDITKETPYQSAQSFTFEVLKDAKGEDGFVAVSKPKEVPNSQAEILGKASVEYGKDRSGDDVQYINVDFLGDPADNAVTAVKAYQWYLVTLDEGGKIDSKTPLVGEKGTAPNLNYKDFPTQMKAAGTYYLACDVTVERQDNGRQKTITSDVFTFNITKRTYTMHVNTYPYEGIYDGEKHHATVSVTLSSGMDPDYDIYYSERVITAADFENGALKAGVTDVFSEPLQYSDVKPYTTDVLPYDVYFYILDKSGNFADYAEQTTVKILPKTLTISRGSVSFSKVYDGLTAIGGEISHEGEDSNKYKFAKGNGVYFTINGLVEADKSSESILLDFDDAASGFNFPDVDKVSSLTVAKMKISNPKGEQNYDYVFPESLTMTFPAAITPYLIEASFSDVREFDYDGNPHAPELLFSSATGVRGEVLTADITGAKTNVGSHFARATVKVDGTTSSNYAFKLKNVDETGSCPFTIKPRPVTITPIAKSVQYNGTTQRITDFIQSGLLAGHDFTASTDKGQLNVGTTEVTAEDVKITTIVDAKQVDVTANYEITLGSADLTVTRKEVTVTGVKAYDKGYDGTRVATLDLSNASIEGLCGTDRLTLKEAAFHGNFDTILAGEGKPVTVTFDADALATGNVAPTNYRLVSVNTPTAAITHNMVTVAVKEDKSVVYGDTAVLELVVTYPAGITTDEKTTIDTALANVKYMVRPNSETAWAEYGETVAVGEYEIAVDLSAVITDNYKFNSLYKYDNYKVAAYQVRKLTVEQREVTIRVKDGVSIKKTYDNGVAVGAATDAAFVGATSVNDGIVIENVMSFDSVLLVKESDKTTEISLLNATASYADKNVAYVDNKVTFSKYALDNANYKLADGQDTFRVNATIVNKEIQITATNKTMTYGGTIPSYADNLSSKLASGETYEDSWCTAAGNIIYTSGQDVGDYTITVATYSIPNYTVTGTDGTLHVEKAKITVRVNDMTVKYGLDPAFGLSSISRLNHNSTPYTNGLKGFVLGQTESVVTGLGDLTYKVVKVQDDVQSDVADANVNHKLMPSSDTIKYEIVVLGVGSLSATNYDFEAENAKLTIGKKTIDTVKLTTYIKDAIKNYEKVYDGLTDITSAMQTRHPDMASGLKSVPQENIDAWEACGLHHEDDAYIANGLKLVKAEFETRHVGTDKVATLTFELDNDLKTRYFMTDETQKFTVTVGSGDGFKITPAPLYVKISNIDIKYGTIPEYNVAITGFVNGEKDLCGTDSDYATKKAAFTNEQLTTVLEEGTAANAGKSLHDRLCGYMEISGYDPMTTQAGTKLKITLSKQPPVCGNYAVEYQDGTGSVISDFNSIGDGNIIPNTFPNPKPQWVKETPGTASFTALADIGSVKVKEYHAVLYKKTGASTYVKIGTTKDIGLATTVDFSTEIKGAGAGQYVVKVFAEAEPNGTNYQNVTEFSHNYNDTDYTDVSGTLAATTLEMKYDTATEYGVATFAPSTASKSIIIAGESLDYTVTMENATGYYVNGLATNDEKLTCKAKDLGTVTGAVYANSVSLSKEFTDATKPLIVTVTMAKNKAHLAFALKNTDPAILGDTTLFFNYPAGTNIQAVIESEPAAQGYTYSYTWTYRTGMGGFAALPEGTDSDTIAWNTGRNVAQYTLRCTITATRGDNGETATDRKDYIIRVDRANVDSLKATVSDWNYGEARSSVGHTTHPEVDQATIKYYYRKVGETDWTEYQDGSIQNVGKYQMALTSTETANYGAVDTREVAANIVNFEVKAVTQGLATNLNMLPSPTAAYGLAKWTGVDTFKENGDSTTNYVPPTYRVVLQKMNAAKTDWENVPDGEYTGAQITDKEDGNFECDMTAQITAAGDGQYRFLVYTSTDTTHTTYSANVVENLGNPVEYDVDLHIGADYKVSFENGKATLDNPSTVTQTYDRTTITLTSTYSSANPSVVYQWYKNGTTPVGSGKTLQLKNVADSGNYTCKIVDATDVLYTQVCAVTISKATQNISVDNKTETYNKTPIESNTAILTGVTGETISGGGADGLGLGGLSYHYYEKEAGTDTYKSTEIGTAPEHAGTYKVVVRANETANYSAASKEVTLTILQKEIGLSWKNTETNGTDLTTYIYSAANPGISVTATGVLSGDTVNLTFDYDTDYNAGDHTATVKTISNADYKLPTVVTKEYKIAKKALTMTAKPQTITYGDAPANDGVVFSGFAGSEDESAGSLNIQVSYTYDYKQYDNVGNTYQITPACGTLTNYIVTPVNGLLTVNQKSLGTGTETPATGITVASVDAKTYNRLAYEPEPEVKHGDRVLRTGTDITYSYAGNVNAGTATITVTGQGNYTGTVIKRFTINPITLAITAEAKESTFGEAIKSLTYTLSTPIMTGDDLHIVLSCDAGKDADNSKVGTYPITVAYDTTNSNYSVTTTGSTYTIVAADMPSLTVTGAGTFDYAPGTSHAITVTGYPTGSKVYFATEELTAANYAIKGTLAPAGILATSASLEDVNGAGTTVYYYVVCDNYNPTSGNRMIKITPIDQVIGTTTVDLDYTGAVIAPATFFTATTAQGTITYSVDAAKNNGVSEIFDKGTYTITVNAAATNNYKAATKDVQVKVKPLSITLKAKDKSKTYDGTSLTQPEYTLESGSLTATDAITALTMKSTSTIVNQGSVQNEIDKSSIVIQGTGSRVVTGNYTITVEAGTLSISTKSVGDGTTIDSALTIDAIPNVTYNKTAKEPALTIKYGSLTLVKDVDYEVGFANNVNAGTANVTVTGKGNYSGSFKTSFVIDPITLVIQAEDVYSVYNPSGPYPQTKTALEYEFTTGNVVTGDDLNIVLATQACEDAAHSVVGHYEITVSYDTTNTNYLVTAEKGTYSIVHEIMPALTVTGQGTYTYDPTVEHEITVSGYPVGTVVYYAFTLLTEENYATAGSTTCPKIQDVNGEGQTLYYIAVCDNYSSRSGHEKIQILPAEQVITATTQELTYNGSVRGAEDFVTAASASGGGTITYVFDTAKQNNGLTKLRDSGDYVITVNAAATANYKEATKDIEVKINPIAISLTAEDATKIYDGLALTENGYKLSAGALATTDTIKAVSMTEASTITEHGTKSNEILRSSVVIENTERENVVSDYTITLVPGTLAVTAKEIGDGEKIDSLLTIAPIPDMVYDKTAKEPELSIQYNGLTLVKDTDYTVVFTNNVNKGTAVAEVTGKGNYKGSFKTAFEITPILLTITAENAESDYQLPGTYPQAIEKLTYRLSAQVMEGDDLQIKLSTVAGKDAEHSKVGTYPIVVEAYDSENQNYMVTTVDGTYTIKKAAQKITAQAKEVVYNGQSRELADLFETVITTGDGTLTYELDAAKQSTGNTEVRNAGEYVVTITAADTDGFYEDTKDVTVKVLPKPVVLRWSEERSFTYDKKEHQVTASIVNLEEQDVSKVWIESYKDASATSIANYIARVTKLGGEASANYTLENAENIECSWEIVKGQDGVIQFRLEADPNLEHIQLGIPVDDLIRILKKDGSISDEELEEVENGHVIDIYLTVDIVTGTISEESKQLIEANLGDYTVGQFLDINLYKRLIVNGVAEEAEKISETDENLSIHLKLPDEMNHLTAAELRTIKMLRNHSGKVEMMETSYDPETKMITFATDRFSDYAVVYLAGATDEEETPGQEIGIPPTQGGNGGNTGSLPVTGDTNELIIWLYVLFISSSAFTGILYYDRKKKQKNK